MIDFNDVIADIDHHLKRIGWDKEKGKEYLLAKYGKPSRLRLEDNELLEFRDFLANYEEGSGITLQELKIPRLRLRSLSFPECHSGMSFIKSGEPPF